MNNSDYIRNTLELINETCHLKHSRMDPAENHPAVEFLCQHIGHLESEDSSVIDYTIQIPICEECAEALQGDEWVLLFCLNCSKSQWVLRALAKKVYHKDQHVVFMEECPCCKCDDKNNL